MRPEDIAHIPVLRQRPRYIVYAPLATTPLPPDAILIFVRADQTLILSEASQMLEGGLPPAMGRPACAVIPQATNAALYAIPGPRLGEYAERVTQLAQANAILTTFHRRRRIDVEAGKTPTVQQSLAAMPES